MLFMNSCLSLEVSGSVSFLCLVSWDREKGISCGTTCVQLTSTFNNILFMVSSRFFGALFVSTRAIHDASGCT